MNSKWTSLSLFLSIFNAHNLFEMHFCLFFFFTEQRSQRHILAHNSKLLFHTLWLRDITGAKDVSTTWKSNQRDTSMSLPVSRRNVIVIINRLNKLTTFQNSWHQCCGPNWRRYYRSWRQRICKDYSFWCFTTIWRPQSIRYGTIPRSRAV